MSDMCSDCGEDIVILDSHCPKCEPRSTQQEGQERYYLQKFGDRAGICIIDRDRSGEKEAMQFDICMCRNKVEAKSILAILNQSPKLDSGDANHFAINVDWVEIDGASGFAATTPQFPDVAEYADNRMDVLSLIGDTIDTFQSILANGDEEND